MSDVIFEEEQKREKYSNSVSGAKTPFMYKHLIKLGVVKTQKQAAFVLLLIAIVLLGVSGVLFMYSQGERAETVYREDIPEDIYNSLPAEVREQFPSRNE